MIQVEVFLRGQTVATTRVEALQARVGREPDNEVHLEGLGVSSRHCLIERRPDGSWSVQDLSGGWTQLDGAMVRGRVTAAEGATLGVGVFELTFRWVEAAADDRGPQGAPARAPDLPEKIGDYEVLRELGRGSMGLVVAARDGRLRRDVAIKLLKEGRWATALQRARFRQEAQALAMLQHPSIVEVFEVGDLHETPFLVPFLVMELVQGESLERRLQRAGPLPLALALRVAEELARGLAHAHARELLHRDVKPANVLLREDGAALLTDFGLAKDLAAGRARALTAPGASLGTPGFCPPEQLEDAMSARAPADVFGLGATLYAATVGLPPFAQPRTIERYRATREGRWTRPTKIDPKLPADLDAVLERCLAPRAQDRYPTALELADDLARLRRGEAPLARQRPGVVGALDALMDLDLNAAGPAPEAATCPEPEAAAGPEPEAAPGPEPAVAPGPEPADEVASSPPATAGESNNQAGAADEAVAGADDAPQAAAEAAQDAPEAARVDDLTQRARELFAAGDPGAAVALLDEALALAPQRAALWTMRAVARRRLGDERGALADHGQALRRDPDDVGARVGRGLIRLRLRDYARAARDLERALRHLTPGSERERRVRASLDRARAALGSSVLRGFRVDQDSDQGPVTP